MAARDRSGRATARLWVGHMGARGVRRWLAGLLIVLAGCRGGHAGADVAGCTARHGSLSYRQVGGGRVAVYLPGCAVATDRRFRTVYLLRGSGMDEKQWPALGLAGVADDLIASGQIAPLIVVMPGAGLAAADSSVVDTVLPWADTHLPTSATAVDRAIGGISAGGEAAMRIVGVNPTLFSRLGGHSALVPDDPAEVDRLVSWAGAIWLDVGSGDGLLRPTEGLSAMLQARGVRTQLHEWPGRHQPAYWTRHLRDYLRFYADPGVPLG